MYDTIIIGGGLGFDALKTPIPSFPAGSAACVPANRKPLLTLAIALHEEEPVSDSPSHDADHLAGPDFLDLALSLLDLLTADGGLNALMKEIEALDDQKAKAFAAGLLAGLFNEEEDSHIHMEELHIPLPMFHFGDAGNGRRSSPAARAHDGTPDVRMYTRVSKRVPHGSWNRSRS